MCQGRAKRVFIFVSRIDMHLTIHLKHDTGMSFKKIMIPFMTTVSFVLTMKIMSNRGPNSYELFDHRPDKVPEKPR